MTSSVAHSPLETLILFQSIVPSDGELPSFENVSKSLKNNEMIRESESSDTTRLDPDSLKALYIRLVKEEVKAESLGNGNAGLGSPGQTNLRKRKLSSPSLESGHDASQYSHLMPQILSRLYTRYRDHAIKAIEEEERKYRLLQRDIQEINRGEWDARLQHQEVTLKRDSRGTSSIQTLLRNDDLGEKATEKAGLEGSRETARSPSEHTSSALPSTVTKPIASQTTQAQPVDNEAADRSIRSEGQDTTSVRSIATQPLATVGAEIHDGVEIQDVVSQSVRSLLASDTQQASITHQDQQRDSRPTSQPNPTESARTSLLTPQYVASGYSLASPTSENRRLPPPTGQTRTGIAPSLSPRLNQTPLVPPDSSSATPIILPPPPGMLRSSGSPTGPLDALADMAGQQNRPYSALPPPRPGQALMAQQHPVQLPQPRNFMQRAYPYYDSQTPYSAPFPSYGPNPLPPYHPPNHSALPAYHSTAPSLGKALQYSNLSQYQSPLPPYYPGYNQGSLYYPQTPVQASYSQNQQQRFSGPQTPALTASGRRRPPKPSPIDTSTSSTKWRNVEASGSIRSPRSPTRPRVEEISPISEKAPSPAPDILRSRSKGKGTQNIAHTIDKEASGGGTPRKPTRTGRSGTSISKSRGIRAASTTSSAVAGSFQTRTRSQSLGSHADELSIDAGATAGYNIKPEPPATPAGGGNDDDASITETTADEGSRKSTRRRRETLRGLEMTEIVHRTSTNKRKRANTLDDTPSALQPSPSFSYSLTKSRPNQILGSRNFPRTSATVMNDITGHKLASMFAKPLTEREAPGYKDLIYRPQDLKSIKTAIAAGSRALITAVDNVGGIDAGSPSQGGGTPTNTSKSSSSTIWMPASADVMPPKVIVNSAQLEKELMRMFANAVMFNPDPKRGVGPVFQDKEKQDGALLSSEEVATTEDADNEEEEGGVVHDTREMYQAVEKSVADWRAAERAVEDMGGGVGTGTVTKTGSGKVKEGGEKVEDVGEADELAGEGGARVGPVGKRRRRRR